jgi:SAM-dependent methyltransferase
MAHPQQRAYCEKIASKYPNHFRKVRVLDIGSLDINGSNRTLFKDCEYHGIDVGVGKGVDFISTGHKWSAVDGHYDTIISTECFEHDKFYAFTLQNAVRMLKSGGLLVFTCATTGRPEHGTRRTSPYDSPLTCAFNDWQDYYKNLTQEDVEAVLNCPLIFKEWSFETNAIVHDLYFAGIKH